MLLLLKGGPGSGNHGHRGRPGQVGGSAPASTVPAEAPTLPSSAGITSAAEARDYWKAHLADRTLQLNVTVKSGTYAVRVTFDDANTHMWTRAAHDGDPVDAYDRPRHKGGPRTFDPARAVLMDRLHATIASPWKVLESRGREMYLGAKLPDGGTYVVVLTVRAQGDCVFASAHPRDKDQVQRFVRENRPVLPGGRSTLLKSETPPLGGVCPDAGDLLGQSCSHPSEEGPAALSPSDDPPATATLQMGRFFDLVKALGPGERWITVHSHGPDGKGQPILIRNMPDGSAKVIGGAGGSLNHLRLTGVKSEAEYANEARDRAKAHRDKQKRQTERDREAGLLDSKKKAREAVKLAVRDHEAKFVRQVAETLGWTDEDLRFPAEKYQNLSPAAQEKAERDHGRRVLQAARTAVDQQRQRLVQDAEMRSQADLGEVPLTGATPDAITVQDLAPVPAASAGLGFAPAYDKRAAEHGLTPEAREEEAAAFKPATATGPAGATEAAKEKRELGAKIAAELATVRDPGPPVDLAPAVDARAAVELLKAERALKAIRATAVEQNRKIDAAKVPVEPQAFPVEVEGKLPDEAITRGLEEDLRTLRTRAFLDEVGKVEGGAEAIGRHVAVGAYNSLNSLSLAAAGAALMDRSAVDVLGIAGSAQVLARRLAKDMTPEELGHIRDAMERFHVDHYMAESDKALREAREWHEMAHEIELGEAASGADLAVAQELNARRREFVASAERSLGTALGEMEANAALVHALAAPKREQAQISLGATSVESAITRLRALGLERGEYSLARVGRSTMLTLTGAGMDRLAAPVAREDLLRVQTALSIINGHQDEDGWLPRGVASRPESVMDAPIGVAPRLARPFSVGEGGVQAAVEAYIGGRAADGDAPADIMAGLLSEDTLRASGDRAAFLAAVEKVAPLYGADGKLVRAESHAAAFEAMADRFVEQQHGGTLAPIHRQRFEVDQVAVDALHAALADHPEGVAAFKPVGELTPQDQRGLREVFAREFGRADPEAEGLHAELAKLAAAEPEAEVDDMFGRGPNPAHAEWRTKRDELAARANAATMTWGKYLDVMGSPANAYAAMQDVVRSGVLQAFADSHNRAKPGAALKVGRTVIAHDLNHLDALDATARESRLAQHRDLVDSLRNRVAGRYAAGGVAEKLDAARAQEEAFGQSQMGLFGPGDESDDSDARVAEAKPLAMGERHTIGHQAERQVAGMMPLVGRNFRPGQKVPLWSPSMSGKYVARQRAVKLIEANRRVVAGLGVGSGKTSISLSAWSHLHEQGKARKGLFAVPSIVQGQFHGEALTLLQPGKYDWHCVPGADRAERIAAYKDPGKHFVVVTHQSLRDDLLHLAGQRDGITPDAAAEKLAGMKPAARRDYMKALLAAEGIDANYLAVDEGHTLLNREGKEDSRMATVLDALGHSMDTHVSMTADPVKNDASEAFDVLAKMDPERYSDRAAFMRRYGVDTAAAKDALKREMARHFYTASIDPGVQVHSQDVPVELDEAQHARLGAIDAAAAAARLARMKGKADLAALRVLSPASFEGVPEAQHEAVGQNLNRSIGILANSAVQHAMGGGAKTAAIVGLAGERKGKQGVVFAHHLDRVREIEAGLKAAGHRVVTLTGADSTKDKDRKKREYQDGNHDVIVLSDAGAVGANLQRGKWLVQADTPDTAMLHAQRRGRIHRIGQNSPVELLDLVANHPAERRARKRLAGKYELRSIMTSPLEGLDDSGVAGYLQRARAGRLEAAEPVHAPTPAEAAAHPAPEPEEQGSMF